MREGARDGNDMQGTSFDKAGSDSGDDTTVVSGSFQEESEGSWPQEEAPTERTPQNLSPQKLSLGVEYFPRQQQPVLDDLIFEEGKQGGQADQLLPLDIEGLRKATRQILAQAAEAGKLETTLGELPQRSTADTGLQAFRQNLKQALIGASRSGALSAVVKETKMASICVKAREALTRSAFDGRLVDELSSIKQAKEEPPALNLQRLREQAKDAILRAAGSGQLSQVLEDVQRENRVNETRTQTREVLAKAVLDGRLVEELQALSQAKKAHAPPKEDLRARLQRVFSRSAVDGRLSTSFEQARKEEEDTKAADPRAFLQQMRVQVREDLQRAVFDGGLGRALAELHAEKEESEDEEQEVTIEDLRMQVRATIQKSIGNGSLEAVMGQVQRERQKKVDTLDIRTLVRDSIRSAMFNGRLEMVRHEAAKAREQAQQQEDLDAKREKAREALCAAAHNGTLREILARTWVQAPAPVVAPPELRGACVKAKEALMSAAAQGKLQRLLTAQVPKQAMMTQKVTQDVEETRAIARNILLKAGQDGRLEGVLRTIQPQAADAALEQTRVTALDVMAKAMKEGRLLNVLRDVQTQANSPAAARDVLAKASLDGRLLAALAEVKRIRQPTLVPDLRAMARESLLKGSRDGRLERLIGEMKRNHEPAPVQDLRSMARDSLLKGLRDGRLERFIAEVKRDAEQRVEPDLRIAAWDSLLGGMQDGRLADFIQKEEPDLRIAARDSLLRGMQDGRLAEFIQQAKQSRRAADESQLREMAREGLLQGLRDGRLEQYMRQVKAERAADGSAHGDTTDTATPDVAGMRAELKNMLRRAAGSGSLAEALHARQQQRQAQAEPEVAEEQSDLQEILNDARATLSTAVMDGRLSALRRRQLQRKEEEEEAKADLKMRAREALTNFMGGADAAAPTRAAAAEEDPEQHEEAQQSPKNQVFDDGRVLRKSKRMLCAPGLSQILSPEFKKAASAMKFEGEEPPEKTHLAVPVPTKREVMEREPTPRRPSTGRISGPAKEPEASLTLRIPASTVQPLRQRRRIIGGVGRTPKATDICLDLTEDGAPEDSAPARESSLVRGYDALGAQFHCMADKDDTPIAVAPSTPASRPPPTPSGTSSRHTARHRVHLAMSSAMALDLADDSAGNQGDKAAFSAMALDLGLGNTSGMRWGGGGSRAATPTNRRRSSLSMSAVRTTKNQGSDGVQIMLPQVYSTKAPPSLPSLSGQRRPASRDQLAWGQQLSWTAPRWGANQALF